MDDDRAVETQFLIDARDNLRAGVRPGNCSRRPAGRQMNDTKYDQAASRAVGNRARTRLRTMVRIASFCLRRYLLKESVRT